MDELETRCSVCNRFSYHSPLTGGVCDYCRPDTETDQLVRWILSGDSHFSPQEYTKAVRYLWAKLNPSISR